LTLQLHQELEAVPVQLEEHGLALAGGGRELVYTYDAQAEHSDIPALLRDVNAAGLELKDLRTTQSSLEDIFVDLVRQGR
jgi:ABC-2 type transport system ATP-binding protein